MGGGVSVGRRDRNFDLILRTGEGKVPSFERILSREQTRKKRKLPMALMIN